MNPTPVIKSSSISFRFLSSAQQELFKFLYEQLYSFPVMFHILGLRYYEVTVDEFVIVRNPYFRPSLPISILNDPVHQHIFNAHFEKPFDLFQMFWQCAPNNGINLESNRLNNEFQLRLGMLLCFREKGFPQILYQCTVLYDLF